MRSYSMSLKNTVKEKEIWTHQVVDSECSRPVEASNYNSSKNTLQAVNTGDLHFEPVFTMKAVQHNKARSPEQSDDDEKDVEITAEEELFYAIRSNEPEAEKVEKVGKLLERTPKLDINYQGTNNDTCLHIAVRKKELQVIKVLVKEGARTNIKNNRNRSPLDVAKHLQRQDIIQILESNIQKIIEERQNEGNEKKKVVMNEKSEEEEKTLRLTDGGSLSDKYLTLQQYNQTTKEECNKLAYEKRPGTTGVHGQLYEIELLMLLLLQAETNEKVKINSFYLATNMQEAGDFDDVVFKYKYYKNGIENSNIIFLQAKHKEAEKGRRLTVDALLSKAEKGDYILRKYLSSYVKIKRLQVKEDHPLFQDGIDRSDFVIYTNSAWNFDQNCDYVKRETIGPENVFYLPGGNCKNCYFQLNANETVKNALRPSLDFEILVRELAQSVYSESIRLEKHIFKDYQVSLANRVIQISEINREESHLRQDFLDGTQDTEFSHALLEEIRKNTNFSSTFSAKSDNELKEELKKKIIKVPKNFGRDQENDLQLPLPNKTLSDETIEEFLNRLKLFVNQPNVHQLKTTTKRIIEKVFEIDEKNDANLIYCKVYSKIIKWCREQGKVKYLTEQDRHFNKAKGNLSNMNLVGLAVLQAEQMKSLGFNFKQDQIEILSKLIREKRILNIINCGDSVLLSTVKVYQALEGMNEYKSTDYNAKYIFMSLTSVFKLQSKVIDAFKSHSRDLLVIECEGTEKSFEDLYEALFNIIKLTNDKKIVLITRGPSLLAERFKSDFFNDGQYEEETDGNNTLADLEIESQVLEEKQVEFQGIDVGLGALVDENSKSLVGADVLCKLIKNEKLEIGKALEDLDEIGYYYIHRTLYRRENISKECFQERNIQDIFLVSNLKKEELSRLTNNEEMSFTDTDLNRQHLARFITLDDDENVQDNLKKLQTKYQTCNIHWLNKEGDTFTWKQSYGSLSNLRDYVDKTGIKEYPAVKISSIPDRIVLVSAEPGMGKSVLLTKLARKEKKAHPSLWIVRINLNDCTKQLNEVHFDEENSLNNAINFLFEILSLKSPLEKELFKHRIENQGGIAFLFDGFDEISPNYKDKVIPLIQILKETKVDKLWITTRPHMRDELEENLSVLCYFLKPLTPDNQELFLKRFWSKELSLTMETDDDRLKNYIKQLLKVLSSSIADRERDFTGIPLQTRMLAEVYQDDFEKFYYSDQSNAHFPNKLNLVDLYQSFIDNKFKYWLKKNQVDLSNISLNEVFEDYRPKFIKKHQVLALQVIFSNHEVNSILLDVDKKILKRSLQEIMEGRETTGIIYYSFNGTLNFVHRTFAEYFAALWLTDNYKRVEVKKLLKHKLFESSNRILRHFFDWILASDKDKNEIHIAILINDVNKANELCSGSQNCEVDKGGRTALHLAAAYGLSEIAKVLLESNPEAIYIEDTIFGWRPLRYANKGNHWHFAKSLLQQGEIWDDMPNAILSLSRLLDIGPTMLHTSPNEIVFQLTESLFQSKANVNGKAEYNKSPLHHAAKNDNFDIVMLLIEQGADVECRNHEGNTVLHYAAKKGNLDVVKFLAEKGAHVQCQNKYGSTVLHSAASSGNLDVVKFLAGKGADVRCKNKYGNTVLHSAASSGNLDVVKFLAEKGADVQCKNKYGNTVLHSAASSGNFVVVKFLAEKGADVQCHNHDGDTVLHSAASSCNLDVVKFVAEKGADVRCKNKYGDTVLHYAASSCNLDVVKFLLKKGADVKCQNMYGNTVLHDAASSGNLDVVKFLLEKGADVQCKNKYGNTVLHFSASSGNLDVVKFLAGEGADMQCKNKYGNTVLHDAVCSGNLDVVKYLLENGADVQCQNHDGDAVLHCAASSGHLDVVKFLLENGADIQCQNIYGNTVLHSAASSGNLDIVKFLAEKGADVRCKNKCGNTVLHFAASSGNLDLVKFLLEKGAKVQCKNKDGNTVLYSAASSGYWDIVKLLTEKGANVQCKNKLGNTVLHDAASSGNLDVVKFLVEKGADIECHNRDGNTVLHTAFKKGNLDIVKFLFEHEADLKCKNKRYFILRAGAIIRLLVLNAFEKLFGL